MSDFLASRMTWEPRFIAPTYGRGETALNGGAPYPRTRSAILNEEASQPLLRFDLVEVVRIGNQKILDTTMRSARDPQGADAHRYKFARAKGLA